jgi:flavin reductase (DIM6/NTAB) family NADH-FMN oxidoreductase RutF
VTAGQSSNVGVEEFARFAEDLDYPLYVVTAAHEGQRSGCLVGFTTQVSIDPPQMLVCISDKNHTHTLAAHAALLGVHLLSPDQQHLAELFGEESGDDTDKFRRCSWHPGPDGLPLLDDAARHMVGRVLERIPFADHLGLLVEPVEVWVSPRPVAYTLQSAVDLEPGHSP